MDIKQKPNKKWAIFNSLPKKLAILLGSYDSNPKIFFPLKYSKKISKVTISVKINQTRKTLLKKVLFSNKKNKLNI